MRDLEFPNGYTTKINAIKVLKNEFDSEKQRIKNSEDVQILSVNTPQVIQEVDKAACRSESKQKK